VIFDHFFCDFDHRR